MIDLYDLHARCDDLRSPRKGRLTPQGFSQILIFNTTDLISRDAPLASDLT